MVDRAAHLMGVKRGPLGLPDSVFRMVEENGANRKAVQAGLRALVDFVANMEAKGEHYSFHCRCLFIVDKAN